MDARSFLNIMLALGVCSCGPIEFQVGRKEKVRPEFVASPPLTPKSTTLTTTNLQSFLDSFERELQDDGAKLVLQLKEGLREKLRSYLEQIEESIITNATADINIESPLLQRVKDLGKAQVRFDDFQYFEETQVIENALVGIVGVAVKNQVDAIPAPGQVPKIDLLTTILFYDMGIQLDGTGAKFQNETETDVVSELNWQIIPEEGGESLRRTRLKYSFWKAGTDRELQLDVNVDSGETEESAALQIKLGSGVGHISAELRYGLQNSEGEWSFLNIDRSIKLEIESDSRLVWEEKNWVDGRWQTELVAIDLESLIAELL